MPEYIDVNLLGECNTCRNYVNLKCTTFCDCGESYSPAISKLPIADVVEVVRCKDCKYWFSSNNDDAHYCKYQYGLQGLVAEEDYCSYGERKI